jgi:hypothetical protein
MIKRLLFICSALVLLNASAFGQKTKPWTEWNEKDAKKMLADSAWAQSQTEFAETAPTGGTITPTQPRNTTTTSGAQNTESGENLGRRSAALTTIYHVAFLTAKPVRAAFIRLIELQHPETPAEKVAERRTFIDRDFGDYVVVTVILDGTNKVGRDSAMKLISAANAESIKPTTYLERKDGKRVALVEYQPPAQDGMGAKFIFPRQLDGQPFLDANSGELRVNIQLGKAVKVNRRFKVAEMMYDGKLEY